MGILPLARSGLGFCFGSVVSLAVYSTFFLSIFVFYFLLSVEGELVDGVGHKKRKPFKLCPFTLFVNVKNVFVAGCYIFMGLGVNKESLSKCVRLDQCGEATTPQTFIKPIKGPLRRQPQKKET